jgi:predicted tellurium resistance membrane protein TerC
LNAVGARPDRSVDIGVLATVSTGVLALSTLVIARLGQMDRYRELSWLVYPLLIGIGVKMAGQDFKHSRPATLFIAMALFGAALIVAPRLRRVAVKTGPPAGSAA